MEVKTINDVHQLKLETARKIRDLTIDFEDQTGCKIADISLKRSAITTYSGMGTPDLINMELEVKL